MINNFWINKKVLITAGPTKEYLDPVRFITNESSGKMGYALAEKLDELGAEVILISGPVQIQSEFPCDKIRHVVTALEMYEESKAHFGEIDVAIFAAAVADYRPLSESKEKIKKKGEELTITFIKNPDIAYEFGKVKKLNQISIGFALETNDIVFHAKEKLVKKNLNFVVINSPNLQGEGFGGDTNRISILAKHKSITNFELKSKKEVANDILAYSELSILS